MSLELYVFLPRDQVPDRATWQQEIDRLGFGVVLDPELDLDHDSGFSPTRVADQASGFELVLEDTAAVIQDFPDLDLELQDRDCVITFRWGGDFLACACVMAAAAALVDAFQALVYDPEENVVCSVEDLRRDYGKCLHEVQAEHPA